MDHVFTILLAGEVTPTPRLLDQVSGSRCIAADGGIHHAKTLKIEPELWVGDFDSAVPSDGDPFVGMQRESHPPAKDATDGELAIAHARKRGAASLVLVGAFGGRTDHTFAIMAAACALCEQGLDVCLTNGREEATPLTSQWRGFDYPDQCRFSVLAFSDLTGLSLKGARWPLDAISMPFGDTLTLSNQVQGSLESKLERGRALLLADLTTTP